MQHAKPKKKGQNLSLVAGMQRRLNVSVEKKQDTESTFSNICDFNIIEGNYQ